MMTVTTNPTIGNRYILHEKLGAGAMGVVYRSTDRLTGEIVGLKRVTTPDRQLQFASMGSTTDVRIALAQEFQHLASLRHPHIITVLDYGFDHDQIPYFTMEYLPDARPIVEACADCDEVTIVGYLIQILEALTYLHQHDILHRDLKPSNILVSDGHVYVLDFGLAVESSNAEEMTVGTLGYMAPEILRAGAASVASDLYAVGVLTYLLLTGKHPFNVSSPSRLLQEILAAIPDVSLIDNPHLAQATLRLLAKDPIVRYDSAGTTILALSNAMNQAPPEETVAIRESFLQAAKFIGRKGEMRQLRSALEQAINGSGSSWLVGGESGVGKSRLLDELRTVALVEGVMVLRGQGVQEGGQPFQLWRDAIRRLVLSTDRDALQASILKSIVPGISTLLQHEIPDAPALEGDAARKRLIDAIVDLFRKQTVPILLELEDLHWTTESLDVLQQLNAVVADLPLLIIGSYRNDERPALPDELPTMHTINLQRLDEDEIEKLSTAMLGSAGQIPEVLNLLRKETEGNAFFLVEVVRILAQDAGRLMDIGRSTLPEKIFAEGIHSILQRRLDQVSAAALDPLALAAIIGRQLDLRLMQQALGTAFDMEAWLTACTNVAVIEYQHDAWRFTHDKLRDGLLESLSLTQKHDNHRRVGEALEVIGMDDAQYAPALAHHWNAAGHIDKAIQYAGRAGQHAMQLGANRDAMTYYEQVLITMQDVSLSEEQQRHYIDLALKMARVGAFFENANIEPMLAKALEFAEQHENEQQLAQVIGSTGAHHYMKGQVGHAIGHFQRSMVLAEKLNLEELLFLPYNILPRVWFFAGNIAQGTEMLPKGIALSEQRGDDEMLSASLAWMSNNLTVQGRLDEAQHYANRALAIAEQANDPERMAGTLMLVAGAYMYPELFDEARPMLERSLALGDELDMLHPRYVCRYCLGYIALHDERLGEARSYFEAGHAIVQETNISVMVPQMVPWFAEFELRTGDIECALELSTFASELGEQTRQFPGLGEAKRVLGLAYAQQEIFDRAETALHESIDTQRQTGFLNFLAKSCSALATLYVLQGKHDAAQPYHDEAQALFEQIPMRWQLAHPANQEK